MIISEKFQNNKNQDVNKIIDKVKKVPRQKQTIAKLEMDTGTIPHPDILEKYDKLDYPSVAKLIIENTVK